MSGSVPKPSWIHSVKWLQRYPPLTDKQTGSQDRNLSEVPREHREGQELGTDAPKRAWTCEVRQPHPHRGLSQRPDPRCKHNKLKIPFWQPSKHKNPLKTTSLLPTHAFAQAGFSQLKMPFLLLLQSTPILKTQVQILPPTLG